MMNDVADDDSNGDKGDDNDYSNNGENDAAAVADGNYDNDYDDNGDNDAADDDNN